MNATDIIDLVGVAALLIALYYAGRNDQRRAQRRRYTHKRTRL